MIARDYYQNINVYKPRGYFERWYADVWRRRIGKTNVGRYALGKILEEELVQVGAVYENIERSFKFRVYFDDDRDYIMFVLRWS